MKIKVRERERRTVRGESVVVVSVRERERPAPPKVCKAIANPTPRPVHYYGDETRPLWYMELGGKDQPKFFGCMFHANTEKRVRELIAAHPVFGRKKILKLMKREDHIAELRGRNR